MGNFRKHSIDQYNDWLKNTRAAITYKEEMLSELVDKHHNLVVEQTRLVKLITGLKDPNPIVNIWTGRAIKIGTRCEKLQKAIARINVEIDKKLERETLLNKMILDEIARSDDSNVSKTKSKCKTKLTVRKYRKITKKEKYVLLKDQNFVSHLPAKKCIKYKPNIQSELRKLKMRQS